MTKYELPALEDRVEYTCLLCDKTHKPLWRGKPSKTWEEHYEKGCAKPFKGNVSSPDPDPEMSPEEQEDQDDQEDKDSLPNLGNPIADFKHQKWKIYRRDDKTAEIYVENFPFTERERLLFAEQIATANHERYSFLQRRRDKKRYREKFGDE